MKIYTRTGDEGMTGLAGGERIAKDSLRMQAIGDVDELNAVLGLARLNVGPEIDERLYQLQNWLFDLGAELASPREGRYAYANIEIGHVDFLEADIDRMTELLEPLRQFVLPGGTAGSAALHIARTVCRRAERSVLTLSAGTPVRAIVLAFLNRLSDWLFTAARRANQLESVPDVAWQKSEVPHAHR